MVGEGTEVRGVGKKDFYGIKRTLNDHLTLNNTVHN